MTGIEAVVLVVAAAFVFIVVTTLVVVIIGIHQEERRWTLKDGAAPTGVAAMSRWVLGTHCDLRFDELSAPSVDRVSRDADNLAHAE